MEREGETEHYDKCVCVVVFFVPDSRQKGGEKRHKMWLLNLITGKGIVVMDGADRKT